MIEAQILTGKSREHLVSLQDAFIHHAIYDDVLALQQAAAKAGFTLAIASGFRDFDRQMAIWNAKFTGQRALLDSRGNPLDSQLLSSGQKIVAILRWSALPAASRHHWGTDMDIFASNLLPAQTTLALTPDEYLTGHQAPFFHWLCQHLPEFGFYFPYAEDKGGVAVEPWHISHIQLATVYEKALTTQVIADAIADEELMGKNTVLGMLSDIYTRFICNLSPPEQGFLPSEQ